MPLLLFELRHSVNDVLSCETTIQIVLGCLKWSIVDNREDVGIIACSIDQLLPQGFVLVLGEEHIIDRVEQ